MTFPWKKICIHTHIFIFYALFYMLQFWSDPQDNLITAADKLANVYIKSPHNQSYRIVDGYNLVFKHAELSQAGLYKCYAFTNSRHLPAAADVVILGECDTLVFYVVFYVFYFIS